VVGVSWEICRHQTPEGGKHTIGPGRITMRKVRKQEGEGGADLKGGKLKGEDGGSMQASER